MRLLTLGNSNANASAIMAMSLSDWLQKTGTSQQALAEEIGLTQGRVGQIIRRGLPSLKKALDLRERILSATGGKVDLAKDEAEISRRA
jgi:predicted XRE-type DNA-binding protein